LKRLKDCANAWSFNLCDIRKENGVEKVEVTYYELTDTDIVKIGTKMEEPKHEGRHSMLCNFCDWTDYPACRKFCSCGKDEDDGDGFGPLLE